MAWGHHQINNIVNKKNYFFPLFSAIIRLLEVFVLKAKV